MKLDYVRHNDTLLKVVGLVAYPAGGGPQITIPAEHLDGVTAVSASELKPRVYYPALVELDGIDDEVFPCWLRKDHYWNGWAIPEFERDTIRTMIIPWLKGAPEYSDVRDEEAAVRWTSLHDEPEEERYAYGDITIYDGTTLRTASVGGMSWCWSEIPICDPKDRKDQSNAVDRALWYAETYMRRYEVSISKLPLQFLLHVWYGLSWLYPDLPGSESVDGKSSKASRWAKRFITEVIWRRTSGFPPPFVTGFVRCEPPWEVAAKAATAC